jgi:predicted SnoaL-like aldol condensation-catalyzing enzyme
LWYVDDMIELALLTLLSRYVEQDTEDKVMVNLTFVGAAGKGKSRIIKLFSRFPKFKLVTNTSYDQIVGKIIPEIDRGDVLTLGYPEFNKLLARKESTMLSTIAIQNSLIEEGIDCIEMPHANIKFVPSLKANQIAAITTDIFDKYFQNFWEIGYAQRQIFETWRYTLEQIDDMCERVNRNEHLQQEMINHNAEVTRIDIEPMYGRALVPIAKRMTMSLKNMAKQIYKGKGIPEYHRKDDEVIPLRYLKQLRLLCQASALERGSSSVSIEDYERVRRLSRHMNFDFNIAGI